MTTTPITESSFISAADGIPIATYAWTDAGDTPLGVVQISHGLAEHGARYDRLARALNAAGFLAYATDHRGHGRTGQDHLGDFGAAGWDGLIADVVQYGAQLAAEHHELPIFLVGHSMGSFAAQSVIADHSGQYDGVVLSGSTALDALAGALADAPPDAPAGLEAFNAGFEHRTGYEWLSRDEAEVDKYVADPLCGFECSTSTWVELLDALAEINRPANQAKIRKDLPVYILAGSEDPVSEKTKGLYQLLRAYGKAGLTDVTHHFYPGARHEIFNETNRGEVTHELLVWLRSKVPGLPT